MAKILILHHSNGLGGGTKSFFDLIMMLIEYHDITAAIPENSSAITDKLKEMNIKYIELNSPIPIFPYYSGGPSIVSRTFLKEIYLHKNINVIAKELNTLKPDLIIFNTVVTSFIARRINKNIKIICFVRETFKRTLVNRLYKSNFDKYFCGVCFIADFERRYLNLKNIKTIVLPDVVYPGDIKSINRNQACINEGISRNCFNVLFMGGLDNIKGIDVILKAVYLLKNHNIKLILAGYFDINTFEIKNVIRNTINLKMIWFSVKVCHYYKKLYNLNKLHITGYRDNVSNLMCLSDVVVFPSTKAHQSRPAIEAGAYHKPVIISNYEETKEYFRDYYNALVFIPCNPKDLAKKILELKTDKDLLEILGENNFRMTKEYHDYNETKNKLNQFVDECLSK